MRSKLDLGPGHAASMAYLGMCRCEWPRDQEVCNRTQYGRLAGQRSLYKESASCDVISDTISQNTFWVGGGWVNSVNFVLPKISLVAGMARFSALCHEGRVPFVVSSAAQPPASPAQCREFISAPRWGARGTLWVHNNKKSLNYSIDIRDW